jgi:hypothetical protein
VVFLFLPFFPNLLNIFAALSVAAHSSSLFGRNMDAPFFADDFSLSQDWPVKKSGHIFSLGLKPKRFLTGRGKKQGKRINKLRN